MVGSAGERESWGIHHVESKINLEKQVVAFCEKKIITQEGLSSFGMKKQETGRAKHFQEAKREHEDFLHVRAKGSVCWLGRIEGSAPLAEPIPPGDQYMSSGGICGMGSFFLGFSATAASVVMSRPATEAAFWRANRVTFVGSMTPAATRF